MSTTGAPQLNDYGYREEPPNYAVAYVTENMDIYCEHFSDLDDVNKFLEEDIPDYKAIVFEGRKIEDRT